MMKRRIARNDGFSRRAFFVAGTQVLVFGAIAARLYDLQVRQYPHYSKLAWKNATITKLVPP